MRALLLTISQTSRFIAKTAPDFDARFDLPSSRSNASLLYAARHFAERAAPHREAFIRYALPPTFVEDLYSLIQKVEESINDRSAARITHKRATTALDATFKKALQALFEFDVIVANVFRDNPVVMAPWNSARHVRRVPHAKRAAAGAGTSQES